jgi:hypothetical protein
MNAQAFSRVAPSNIPPHRRTRKYWLLINTLILMYVGGSSRGTPLDAEPRRQMNRVATGFRTNGRRLHTTGNNSSCCAVASLFASLGPPSTRLQSSLAAMSSVGRLVPTLRCAFETPLSGGR